tara:strand:+ start:9082 stop:9510 length:429 start_codon:yes stop_codon:yes gene_type:complete
MIRSQLDQKRESSQPGQRKKLNSTPTIKTGIQPTQLTGTITSEGKLKIDNHSQHPFSDIKLTVSYFGVEDNYLDFEDIDIDAITPGSHRQIELSLSPPDNTASATIDISGQKQTFLKRHWKLISTIAALTWGLIVVARRLAP